MRDCIGYAASKAKSPLMPFHFKRRAPQDHDVVIKIHYCGICHSDVHMVKGEWGGEVFPMVPGHEIVGEVIGIGNNVKNFNLGQWVGVGCLVNSCRTCRNCENQHEQYCQRGATWTYNTFEKDSATPTYGGYSNFINVHEDFVLRLPAHLNPQEMAPLLCAGITTYSPLKYWKVSPGQRVGVVGLGGLGHMAVKIASAMGADVSIFTTSENKTSEGFRLGAKKVVLSKNSQQMKSEVGQYDLIINTVSAPHSLADYLKLLDHYGTMVLVGLPEQPFKQVHAHSFVSKHVCLAGSLIGGISETQEMLDFCGQKNIAADIELIPIQKVNEAYERLLRGDVRYRFVIDMKSI